MHRLHITRNLLFPGFAVVCSESRGGGASTTSSLEETRRRKSKGELPELTLHPTREEVSCQSLQIPPTVALGRLLPVKPPSRLSSMAWLAYEGPARTRGSRHRLQHRLPSLGSQRRGGGSPMMGCLKVWSKVPPSVAQRDVSSKGGGGFKGEVPPPAGLHTSEETACPRLLPVCDVHQWRRPESSRPTTGKGT